MTLLFLIFHELDTLEEYWSGILYNVPLIGLSVFLIRLGLWVSGNNSGEMPSSHIWGTGYHLSLVMLTLNTWLNFSGGFLLRGRADGRKGYSRFADSKGDKILAPSNKGKVDTIMICCRAGMAARGWTHSYGND